MADSTSGADAMEFFGGVRAGRAQRRADPAGGDWAYTKRIPLGIVLGIGAWNYPQQIACWKAAPALVAGNASSIFKPSEVTPLGALKIAEIMIEAGLPKGLFNVVQGDREPAAAGQPSGYRQGVADRLRADRPQVAGAAAGQLKHVTMELGGKSPMIVFDDADVESANSGAMLGNFLFGRPVCSNGTRVFVQKGIKDQFLSRLKARTEAIRMGEPLERGDPDGPLVNRSQREKVLGYIEKGKAEGARLLTGGGIPNDVSPKAASSSRPSSPT